MEKVTVATGTLTSSSPPAPENTARKTENTTKYLISIDNLRIVAYGLPKDHESFTEDSFDVASHYLLGPLSPYAQSVLESIQREPVVELRYSQYKVERVHTKR